MEQFLKAILSLLQSFLKAIGSAPAKKPEGASTALSVAPKSVSNIGIIKEFEGLSLTAYKDVVGIWTIGYGHTKTALEGMRITAAGAELLLRSDLEWVEGVLNNSVKVPLNQDEYDALASLVYNIGGPAFKRSTILRMLNNGADRVDVANEFLRWNKAGGKVVKGLTNRRERERQLFLGI